VDPGLSERIYQRLLGPAFATLPRPLRSIHARSGRHRYRGEVEVARGRGALATLCAWTTQLPPNGRGVIEVEIDAADACETWTRRFGGHRMASRLWARDGLLHERLGMLRFGFKLVIEDDVIVWRVERVHALGMRLPRTWFVGVQARESEREGRYCFDVVAALPVVGRLLGYRGWLHVG
jgi:hypothetical protein